MAVPDNKVGDFPLKDKVVVVTGGGGGICARFVKRAADLGAKVINADLKMTDDGKQLLDGYQNVHFVKTDCSKWDQLQNLITVAKEKFGASPDVYVAGAGVFEPPTMSSFWHDPEQDDRYRTVEINLNHPIKLTRIAMRSLVSEDKPGVILPIASVGGIAGTYHCPLYIATKHGVIGFVKSMELAERYENVKIVTICPGAVDSPLWSEEKRKEVNFAQFEALQPDNVAEAMIDLVQEGKYGGGTCLEIMPNNGPKTRVLPKWNIDPPQCGGSTTNVDPTKEIPEAFRTAKKIMDDERGTAKK